MGAELPPRPGYVTLVGERDPMATPREDLRQGTFHTSAAEPVTAGHTGQEACAS